MIDSDDLLQDPPKIVAAWCEAMGIPFIAEALRWTPGERQEVSWWDGGSFHENLRNSWGLESKPRTEIDISDAPEPSPRRCMDCCAPTTTTCWPIGSVCDDHGR